MQTRIMITGAPGSGKELVARAIHDASNRAAGPFVIINAATITLASTTHQPSLMTVTARGGCVGGCSGMRTE